MLEREREREREGERETETETEREGRAIHVLLIHSNFVVAFIISFFSLLYVQYTYSAFVTKIFENVVANFQARK